MNGLMALRNNQRDILGRSRNRTRGLFDVANSSQGFVHSNLQDAPG